MKREGDRVSGGRIKLEKIGSSEDNRVSCLQEQAACNSDYLCENYETPSTCGRGKEFQHDKGVLEIQGEGATYNQRLLSQSKLVKILLTYLPTYLLTPVKNLVPYYPSALVPYSKTPTPNLTSRKTILNCFARQSPLERGKEAFTLAEVLITLGIIGVVAAMTLPTVITNYQKKETVSRLKKVYSTLQQMVLYATKEHGDIASWDYELDEYQFGQKYLKPYLKVMVDSESKEYTWTDLKGTTHYTMNPTLILADGTYLFIKFAPEGYQSRFHIGVDINGNQKPNKSGRDFFVFTLVNNKLTTYNQYTSDWISSRSGIIHTGTSGQCNKNASGGAFGVGSYCSKLIEIDGWEIKDDYPW